MFIGQSELNRPNENDILQFLDDFIIFLRRTKLESILRSTIYSLEKKVNINKANNRAV